MLGSLLEHCLVDRMGGSCVVLMAAKKVLKMVVRMAFQMVVLLGLQRVAGMVDLTVLLMDVMRDNLWVVMMVELKDNVGVEVSV